VKQEDGSPLGREACMAPGDSSRTSTEVGQLFQGDGERLVDDGIEDRSCAFWRRRYRREKRNLLRICSPSMWSR